MSSKENCKNLSLFPKKINDENSNEKIFEKVKFTKLARKEESGIPSHLHKENCIPRDCQLTHNIKKNCSKLLFNSDDNTFENTSITKSTRKINTCQIEQDQKERREIDVGCLKPERKIEKISQGENDEDKLELSQSNSLNSLNETICSIINNKNSDFRTKIEQTLLQVYTDSIKNNKENHIFEFETHFNLCTSSPINSQLNLYILEMLSEKITVAIDKIKDYIYNKKEVKQLKEKFYELKINNDLKNIPKRDKCCKIQSSSFHNPKNEFSKVLELNEKENYIIKEMLIELNECVNQVIESSQLIQRIFSPLLLQLIDYDTDKLNFKEIHKEELARAIMKDEFLKEVFLQIKTNSNNPCYKEFHYLVEELEQSLEIVNKDITEIKTLIEKEIEKILNQKNNKNCNCTNYSNSLIHSHNHFNYINNCPINCLNHNVQNYDCDNHNCQKHNCLNHSCLNHKCSSLNCSNYNCLNHNFISHTSNSPNCSMNNVLSLCHSHYNKLQLQNNCSLINCKNFNRLNTEGDNDVCCLQNKQYSKSLSVLQLNKDKYIDIDDLVDYINEDKNKLKQQNSKRRNNKRDKKENQNNLKSIKEKDNHKKSSKYEEKIEKEIVEIKNNLIKNSIKAFSIRKIKPNISREWLKKLGEKVK